MDARVRPLRHIKVRLWVEGQGNNRTVPLSLVEIGIIGEMAQHAELTSVVACFQRF